MEQFLADLVLKQKILITEFLCDTFDLPATRASLSKISLEQKTQPYVWEDYRVLFHGHGIRFSHQVTGHTIDFDFGFEPQAIWEDICPHRAWVYLDTLTDEKKQAYKLPLLEVDFIQVWEKSGQKQSNLALCGE